MHNLDVLQILSFFSKCVSKHLYIYWRRRKPSSGIMKINNKNVSIWKLIYTKKHLNKERNTANKNWIIDKIRSFLSCVFSISWNKPMTSSGSHYYLWTITDDLFTGVTFFDNNVFIVNVNMKLINVCVFILVLLKLCTSSLMDSFFPCRRKYYPSWDWRGRWNGRNLCGVTCFRRCELC